MSRTVMEHGKVPPRIVKKMTGGETWFDPLPDGRFPNQREVREASMSRYLFLSTKQVPSALHLRHAGSDSVRRNLQELVNGGFPIEQLSDGHWENYQGQPDSDMGRGVSASQVRALSDILSSVVEENARMNRENSVADVFEEEMPSSSFYPDDDDESESSEFEVESPGYTPRERVMYRIKYQDPFVVNAALELARREGRTPPTVRVWEGDVVRLQDNIPARLLGPSWSGRGKKGRPFHSIASQEVKLHVLWNHTHWGHLLCAMAADPDCIEQNWARGLKRTIKWFLMGRPNPRWSSTEREAYLGESKDDLRPAKTRANRFIQVLLTIDGIFAQRFLAYPEEHWDWSRYDHFVLGNLYLLLQDEFLDGEVTGNVILHTKTLYSLLKEMRQGVKEAANLRRIQGLLDNWPTEWWDPLIRQFEPSIRRLGQERDPVRELRIRGTLVQTRCCGTPPHLVALQSKLKFLETVTAEPEVLSETNLGLLRASVKQVLTELPDEAFTGLETKAGVRITSAACYERSKSEAGTAQAIQDIVYEAKLGRAVQILDLDTADVVDTKKLDDLSVGEYVFWRCLEDVLAMDPEELRVAALVVVREPGKPRSVTKARAPLKIVLDVVNGIVSWSLAKGIESSSSGMTKSHHGWNLFKACFGPWRDLVFDELRTDTEWVSPTSKIDEVLYRRVWFSSTDYETATDFLHHNVARELGNAWMLKCGIPPVLRGVVNATCYQPRRIEFTATGWFRSYGTIVDETTNMVTLRRGVLMGDPLTKPVLHLVNVCARQLGRHIDDGVWLESVFTNAQEAASVFTGPQSLSS